MLLLELLGSLWDLKTACLLPLAKIAITSKAMQMKERHSERVGEMKKRWGERIDAVREKFGAGKERKERRDSIVGSWFKDKFGAKNRRKSSSGRAGSFDFDGDGDDIISYNSDNINITGGGSRKHHPSPERRQGGDIGNNVTQVSSPHMPI